MIIDVSKYQGQIDWDTLAPELTFCIIKASGKTKDSRYDDNSSACKRLGIPFHAYHFLYCTTDADAKVEAKLFSDSVGDTKPLFWVMDCESSWGVKDANARHIAEVFEAELRRLRGADIRVAVYVANEKYKAYDLDYNHYAYVWIPKYNGTQPIYPCDIWQYSDKGSVPGINGNVDLDMLMGTKPLAYFTTSATEEKDGGAGMLTGKQLAEYCEKVYKAGWVYWYGTYGKRCTESLYKSKKAQYPTHYSADRTSGYMKDIAEKKRCADCVGMIKSFFWTDGKFDTDPGYAINHCPDVSANGMISLCTETGAIGTIPDEPGLVVWKSGHIGVYVGGGYTVEMKGFNYDCKRNKVTDGPWTKWGRLPASMIDYSGDSCADCTVDSEVGDRWLCNGDEGEDVRQLQKNLITLGYSCGRWGADGDFGDATENALEKFQSDYGLKADGIYGAETIATMEAALDALNELPDYSHYVEIYGGNCYVRTSPNTNGKKLGVAHRGERYIYQGKTDSNGWRLIDYKGQNGWVSGKYSRLVG